MHVQLRTHGNRNVRDKVMTLKKAVTKAQSAEYSGNPECPDVSVTMGGGNMLTRDEDYHVSACFNNVRKGTATMLISGRGDFCGYKTVKFSISARRIQILHNFYKEI